MNRLERLELPSLVEEPMITIRMVHLCSDIFSKSDGDGDHTWSCKINKEKMAAGEVSIDPMVFAPLISNFRQNWSQGGGVGAHMLRITRFCGRLPRYH